MHHFQRKSYEYLMVKQGQNIRNTKTIYIKSLIMGSKTQKSKQQMCILKGNK